MKRILVAIVLVLAAVSPAALAGKSEPPCWWVGYDVSLRGDSKLRIGPYCVPCFRYCDIPIPATSTSRAR